MNSIDKLTEQFKKFPGIGGRQAKRFVYFLLTQNENGVAELSKLISELKKDISQCSSCFRFFKFTNESANCDVCSDPNIDKKILMIVEKDIDFENIKKTGEYGGKFFILGGTIPILEREPTKRIRAKQLIEVVGENKELEEIILALSVNPEGENTLQYVKKILEPLAQKYDIKVTTLGRGLSTGTELEYSDSDTLQNALKNRG